MTEPAEPAALLEIDALGVRRQREALLEDVTLRVRRGTIHVVMGANGAGKSTLLSAILGQIAFDGRIAMNWIGPGTIGYVPQAFAVDPTLPVTVADFLALTRQRLPVCFGITRVTRIAIARLLGRVGLPGLEDRPLAVLSGGELRRVLLAHALDPEPELLILDEPSAGLDDAAMGILNEILLTLKRGGHTTVLMVTHDLEQVRAVVDQVTIPGAQHGAPMTAFYAWIGALAQRGVLPADFQYPFLVRGFLCVLVLAPILGGVSHLVVTRRMAFFSAAPGAVRRSPASRSACRWASRSTRRIGGMGLGFCLLSTLGMVYVKRHATLPPDTLIGVFHALTLGLGLCLLVVDASIQRVHQVESGAVRQG